MSKNRRLSTAIHLLTALAYRGAELTSSDDLAVGLRTNPALVRRILSRLVKAGLVESQLGKGGGNRLAKPASKIRLHEIYNAVREGPLFPSFEKEPFEACPVSCNMGRVLDDLYSDLETDLVKKMKTIKLADITDSVG